MIINSTYWINDRIKSILAYYHISQEGISFDKAKLFVDDVRDLFFPLKNEYNEARKYGSFQQFKINVRRLFSTSNLQIRYTKLIEQIFSLLDETRYQVIKEEAKANLR